MEFRCVVVIALCFAHLSQGSNVGPPGSSPRNLGPSCIETNSCGPPGKAAELNAPCSNTNPCPFQGGQQLTPQPEVVSDAGKLDITLVVDVTELKMEWLSFFRRTFNGSFPAPTWRVRRGDVVNVRLVNKLSNNQPVGQHNKFRLPNTTNLHTHGLHISSASPGDDVFVRVNPGMDFNYTFNIDPENPSGTYWYHPHFHGSTFLQVESGMAGMIIVEDRNDSSTPDNLKAVSCPWNCQHEIALLFQPSLLYIDFDGRGFPSIQKKINDDPYFMFDRFKLANGQGTLHDYATSNIYHFTTNGQLWPHVNITTGQVKRFRMVNAGGSSALELTITGPNGTTQTGCQFKEIAIDGIYLDKARTPHLSKTYLVPSAKADWLVVCDRQGVYELRSMNDSSDNPSMANAQRSNVLLLTIYVKGIATTTIINDLLPTRQSFVSDFRNLTQDQVHGRFVVEVNPSSTLNRKKFIDATDFRFKAVVGTVQEWYFTNTNEHSAHPIHIHVNHFQVISYNKYTGPVSYKVNGKRILYGQDGKICYYQPDPAYATADPATHAINTQYLGHDARYNDTSGNLGYARLGDFHDVLHIPPLVNITIRFMVHKFAGTAVVHCHILKHEDQGMMFTLEYVKNGTSTEANTMAGNGYPGQCQRCDPYPFNQVDPCGSQPVGQPGQGQGQVTTAKMTTTSGGNRLGTTRFLYVYSLLILIGYALLHI